MELVFATAIITTCFAGLGLGILFFGRKELASECGTVPTDPDAVCPSQEAGLCPMEDTEGYLKMATTATHRGKAHH
ncbi:hypothetical protein HOH87_08160 [bacterium]|nr:hypothetical protein [bacterium]